MVTSGYNLTEFRDHRDVFKSVHVTGIKLDGYSLHSIFEVLKFHKKHQCSPSHVVYDI